MCCLASWKEYVLNFPFNFFLTKALHTEELFLQEQVVFDGEWYLWGIFFFFKSRSVLRQFWFVGAACLVVHLFACWVWGAIWHQWPWPGKAPDQQPLRALALVGTQHLPWLRADFFGMCNDEVIPTAGETALTRNCKEACPNMSRPINSRNNAAQWRLQVF